MLFWIDIAAYGFASIMAGSLTLMILSVGRGTSLSRLFALFTLLEAVSAMTAIILRITLSFTVGDPQFWLHLSAITFCLMGPVLLMFTSRYTGRNNKYLDLLSGIGIIVILTLSPFLFTGNVITRPGFDQYRLLTYSITPLGIALSTIPIIYYSWALWLFWTERKLIGEQYICAGLLLLVAGLILGGILRPHFPIMSITTTASVMTLGVGIVKRQILNPLKDYSVTLEREVANRTSDLARTAKELEAMVKGRELLIREIHHRVKNNIQVILGLIGIHSSAISDQETLKALEDLDQRIRTIMLVHDMLYKSESVATFRFSDYIGNLVTHLAQAYNCETRGIGVSMVVEDIPIDMNRGINIGLIITELITNAMKYAFPEPDTVSDPSIVLSLWIADNSIHLTVADNGIGLPVDFDPATTSSFGISLLYLLVTKQMRGSANYDTGEGTKFTVTLPQADS